MRDMKHPKNMPAATPATSEGVPYGNGLNIPMNTPKGIPAAKNSFRYLFIFHARDLAFDNNWIDPHNMRSFGFLPV